jgi:predicted nucleic acid-binding protein
MRYLIDTDWVIPHLDDDPAAGALLAQLANDGIAVSIITRMEAWEGIYRAPDPRATERKYRAFSDAVPLLPFRTATATRCARLRHDLRQQGRSVRARALDLMIAATALEYGLTLVRRNRPDYRGIPNLVIY